jgi:salicylate hydroxylase
MRALQIYCAMRRERTHKVQGTAARNGTVYHFRGIAAWMRDKAMGAIGGPRLIRRYDWIYHWQPPRV